MRVGVLDDHRSFGEALCMALSSVDDLSCIGMATSVDELIGLALVEEPDVLLLDYQLNEGTGIDAAVKLVEAGVGARMILVTAHASPDVTARALEKGIERVMSKESPLDQIAEAVRIAPKEARPTYSSPPARVSFSRRQREVLELMGQGLDPASIAEVLYISVHTARSHVKDVLRVLGASTQLSAVTKAIRDGYLLPPSKSDPVIDR